MLEMGKVKGLELFEDKGFWKLLKKEVKKYKYDIDIDMLREKGKEFL